MANNHKELKRVIGPWGLASNLVNIVIGAGIFVLPALIAESLGPASIFAYLFCGILIALVMLCFAEASSKVPKSGGAYAIIEAAFGKYVGFITSIFFVCSAITADAAVANALVNIVANFLPFFGYPLGRVLFFAIVFGIFGLINIIGVKSGLRIVIFLTLSKLIPLLLLVSVGWTVVDFNFLAISTSPSFIDIGSTSLLLFFAFQGAESGLTVGGEVKNPNKNIPKGIFIAITAILCLYILIQTVSLGVLGPSLSNFKENPLSEVAKHIFGPIGFSIMTIAAAISMTGNLSSEAFSMPRVLFGAAKDGVLPVKQLAKIHKKFKTPYVAIGVYVLIAFTFASIGGFKTLAIISSASMLFIYLGVAISVIKLKGSMPHQQKYFQIPGGLVIPILTILVVIWFLSNLSKQEWTGILIFVTLISAIYFAIKLFGKKQ